MRCATEHTPVGTGTIVTQHSMYSSTHNFALTACFGTASLSLTFSLGTVNFSITTCLGQPVPEPQCIPRLPVSHSQCRLRDVSGCAGIIHTISHSIKTEPTFESLMIDLTSSPSLSLDVQQQSSLPMMSQTSSVLSSDSSPSPSPTCISGEPEPHSCIPGSSLSSQSPARPGCQPSYSLSTSSECGSSSAPNGSSSIKCEDDFDPDQPVIISQAIDLLQ
eukprot:1139269_1